MESPGVNTGSFTSTKTARSLHPVWTHPSHLMLPKWFGRGRLARRYK